jgi:hypothetical protein
MNSNNGVSLLLVVIIALKAAARTVKSAATTVKNAANYGVKELWTNIIQ